MKKVLVALALAALSSTVIGGPVPPVPTGFISNSPAVQNAQMNITSATIRGTLTVSTVTAQYLAISTLSVTGISGNGSLITKLNASNIASGTLSTTTISGNYQGITGIGIVSSGTWKGTAIGTQYGGTGQNFSSTPQGGIPFFSSVGTMSVLAAGQTGQILQSQGASANPVWVSSPAINGTNITGIPLVNLSSGQLPMSISINDGSISTVSAAKVIGNIPGKATNITGDLALTQLSTGTLITTIVASSITASGVTPGIWGGQQQLIQETVGSDGRITSISQTTNTVSAPNITTGTLSSYVIIPLSDLSAGTLATNVVASSITATGITPGLFGGSAGVMILNIRTDGRLASISTAAIALPLSQLNSGSLPAGVLVPTANISSGTLATNVVASSITASGVASGIYGSPTQTQQLTVGSDGRITSIVSQNIPAVSTYAALVNVDNNWAATQTFKSSITINNLVFSTQFVGNGSSITTIVANNVNLGTLPDTQLDSSSVTLQGNAFNGNTQLIRTTAAGKFPALDGSLITGIGGVLSGLATGYLTVATGATTIGNSHVIDVNSPVVTTTMTVQGSAFSVGGSSFTVTGGSATVAFNFTARSLNVSGPDGVIVGQSSITTTGSFFGSGSGLTSVPASALNSSSVTLQGNAFNGASQLAQLASSGNLTVIDGVIASTGVFSSTLTIQGSGFSVGGSTLTTVAGRVGISTSAPTDTLSVSGSVNITSGLKYNTITGTNGSLTGTQTMCGGTWNNGIYTGGAACAAGVGGAILTDTQTFSAQQTMGAGFLVKSGGQEVLLSTSNIGYNLDISSAGMISILGNVISVKGTGIAEQNANPITITGGQGTGTSVASIGGPVVISGGNSSNTTNASTGGGVTISAGNSTAVSGNSNGGSVSINAGKSNTNTGGSVSITMGSGLVSTGTFSVKDPNGSNVINTGVNNTGAFVTVVGTVTASAFAGPNTYQNQIFMASSPTWSVPNGVSVIYITMCGGGASGANGTGANTSGGGGGGGAACMVRAPMNIPSPFSGDYLTITVGAGGIPGGSFPNVGLPGSASIVLENGLGQTYTANGGGVSATYTTGGAGGDTTDSSQTSGGAGHVHATTAAGATASTVTVFGMQSYPGGGGGGGVSVANLNGGGGGAIGFMPSTRYINPVPASGDYSGGAGGSSFYGVGGASDSYNVVTAPGLGGGGGGGMSGAGASTGQTGGQGFVLIEWISSRYPSF